MKKGRLAFWTVFLGAASIAALLPEFVQRGEDTVEPVVRPSLAQAALGPVPTGAPAPALENEENGARPIAPPVNLFAAKTWVVAPPPPPASRPAPPPPAPPPTAPPLPFRFMGKFDDATTLKAFLQRDENLYVVGVGDVIEGTYRIEKIGPGQITLIYLPLDIPQTLAVGNPP